jgi:hypothetical protein
VSLARRRLRPRSVEVIVHGDIISLVSSSLTARMQLVSTHSMASWTPCPWRRHGEASWDSAPQVHRLELDEDANAVIVVEILSLPGTVALSSLLLSPSLLFPSLHYCISGSVGRGKKTPRGGCAWGGGGQEIYRSRRGLGLGRPGL